MIRSNGASGSQTAYEYFGFDVPIANPLTFPNGMGAIMTLGYSVVGNIWYPQIVARYWGTSSSNPNSTLLHSDVTAAATTGVDSSVYDIRAIALTPNIDTAWLVAGPVGVTITAVHR